VLAGRASWKAAHIIGESDEPEYESAREMVVWRLKLVWPQYISTVAVGIGTIACAVASSKAERGQTEAAVLAYTVSEQALSRYKMAAKDILTPKKLDEVEDKATELGVVGEPGSTFVVGTNEVLCCDVNTGRYFSSSAEALRKAENEVNFMINHERYVSLNEFYSQLGLGSIPTGDDVGWDSDRLMELRISATLSKSDIPCLAFEFNYLKPI
jgi:hypothetical protein